MLKRIVFSAVLGGVALLVWAFGANAVFGLTSRLSMNRLPNERAVYAMLRDGVTAPGSYIVNPQPTPEGRFPAGEPVFGLAYSGFGHEAAGRMLLVELAALFAAALLASGLLATTSAGVRSRYGRRLLFFVLLGALLAVVRDLGAYGIGGHPLGTALLFAANSVASWTAAGLLMAWAMGGAERQAARVKHEGDVPLSA